MKTNFFYIVIFLCSIVLHTYGKDRPATYEREFEKLDDYLYYEPHIAQEKLDSLTIDFSIEEQELHKPYVQYIKGFLAYHKGNCNKSIALADSALEYFLYSKRNEWIAKCLLLSAYNAEQYRLLNNADKAYHMALSYTNNNKLIGLSNAGLARVAKSKGEPFEVYYNSAKVFLTLTKDKRLLLYAKQLDAWFYPESVNENTIIHLVNRYNHLEMRLQVVMSYKILSRYYIKVNDFHSANNALDSAISICEDMYMYSTILSNLYYMKAKVISYSENNKNIDTLCKKAIKINQEYGLDGNNYYIYSFLSRIAKSENRQDDLIRYLEKKAYTCEIHCNDKLERTVSFYNLFDKIDYIIKNIENLRRRYLIIIWCTSVIFIMIIGALFFRHSKQQKRFHLLETELKDDNIILQKETISLLEKNRNRQIQQNILVSLHQIEQKIEHELELSKTLPNNFLDEYANILLLIEKKLNYLTEAEKRYASLFVLNIPQKEISLLLNVSVGTVKMARTRLRVSLGLSNTKVKTNDHLLNLLK